MGGKAKGKQRRDKFYHLAKEQGYRSRASFKLLQLDAKYRFLPSSQSILDLCAAPGSWLQVAVRRAPVGSFILGVDLVPIRPIRGAHTIVQDITECHHVIRKIMQDQGRLAFDCILHDGAPNVGANWSKDATSQSALVVQSIRLATKFLAAKGTFVTKVFRSQDYSAIIYCLKQLFDKVEVTKPVASRNTSAEIYVIGLKYKAPTKVDPHLTDNNHLFKREDPLKIVDVLRRTKQKRNREGYEDGVTVLWKVVPASDFIWSDNPAVFLGSVNQLSFDDPESLPIKEHELTTEEIKSYCEDLKLHTHSLKDLIKWRAKIRNALASTKAIASDASGNAKDDDASGDNLEVDEDEKLLAEMEELTNALKHKKKKEKKRLAERRNKDKLRKATGMQNNATQDGYHDQDLFSLVTIKKLNARLYVFFKCGIAPPARKKTAFDNHEGFTVKGKKDLDLIDSIEIDEENDDIKVSDSEEEAYPVEPRSDIPSDMDSDDEKRRYDEQLLEMIDRAYEQYISIRRSVANQRKRVKQACSKGHTELFERDGGKEIIADGDMIQDQKNREKGPLMRPLFEEEEPSQELIMEQWFRQDVFAEAAQDGMLLEKTESEEEKEKEEEVKKVNKSSKKTSKQRITTSKTPTSKEQGFEIVPSEPIKGAKVSSSGNVSLTSDEDEEDMDIDTKAEILAYARKMRRKKQRVEIVGDAHKYVFDDDEESLPTWFVEEENRHNKPMKPITKEEVEAMKARFREIDARPAKKVAQAKARKKRAAMKQLEKVRQKSNTIAGQTDISEMSKMKMIDQLYKRAMPKRPKTELVAATKGVQARIGKGKKLVDRRMKKDMRTKGSGKPGKKGKAAKAKGPKRRWPYTGRQDESS